MIEIANLPNRVFIVLGVHGDSYRVRWLGRLEREEHDFKGGALVHLDDLKEGKREPNPVDENPWPHVGACSTCHDLRVCNFCGADISGDRGRCTNGRCRECHGSTCTPGGSTSPGHGFGKSGVRHFAGDRT